MTALSSIVRESGCSLASNVQALPKGALAPDARSFCHHLPIELQEFVDTSEFRARFIPLLHNPADEKMVRNELLNHLYVILNQETIVACRHNEFLDFKTWIWEWFTDYHKMCNLPYDETRCNEIAFNCLSFSRMEFLKQLQNQFTQETDIYISGNLLFTCLHENRSNQYNGVKIYLNPKKRLTQQETEVFLTQFRQSLCDFLSDTMTQKIEDLCKILFKDGYTVEIGNQLVDDILNKYTLFKFFSIFLKESELVDTPIQFSEEKESSDMRLLFHLGSHSQDDTQFTVFIGDIKNVFTENVLIKLSWQLQPTIPHPLVFSYRCDSKENQDMALLAIATRHFIIQKKTSFEEALLKATEAHFLPRNTLEAMAKKEHRHCLNYLNSYMESGCYDPFLCLVFAWNCYALIEEVEESAQKSAPQKSALCEEIKKILNVQVGEASHLLNAVLIKGVRALIFTLYNIPSTGYTFLNLHNRWYGFYELHFDEKRDPREDWFSLDKKERDYLLTRFSLAFNLQEKHLKPLQPVTKYLKTPQERLCYLQTLDTKSLSKFLRECDTLADYAAQLTFCFESLGENLEDKITFIQAFLDNKDFGPVFFSFVERFLMSLSPSALKKNQKIRYYHALNRFCQISLGFNLKTAVGDANLTQSLEPESFAVGRSNTLWECPAPLQSDSNSRSCANLASRTAVSRFNENRLVLKCIAHIPIDESRSLITSLCRSLVKNLPLDHEIINALINLIWEKDSQFKHILKYEKPELIVYCISQSQLLKDHFLALQQHYFLPTLKVATNKRQKLVEKRLETLKNSKQNELIQVGLFYLALGQELGSLIKSLEASSDKHAKKLLVLLNDRALFSEDAIKAYKDTIFSKVIAELKSANLNEALNEMAIILSDPRANPIDLLLLNEMQRPAKCPCYDVYAPLFQMQHLQMKLQITYEACVISALQNHPEAINDNTLFLEIYSNAKKQEDFLTYLLHFVCDPFWKENKEIPDQVWTILHALWSKHAALILQKNALTCHFRNSFLDLFGLLKGRDQKTLKCIEGAPFLMSWNQAEVEDCLQDFWILIKAHYRSKEMAPSLDNNLFSFRSLIFILEMMEVCYKKFKTIGKEKIFYEKLGDFFDILCPMLNSHGHAASSAKDMPITQETHDYLLHLQENALDMIAHLRGYRQEPLSSIQELPFFASFIEEKSSQLRLYLHLSSWISNYVKGYDLCARWNGKKLEHQDTLKTNLSLVNICINKSLTSPRLKEISFELFDYLKDSFALLCKKESTKALDSLGLFLHTFGFIKGVNHLPLDIRSAWFYEVLMGSNARSFIERLRDLTAGYEKGFRQELSDLYNENELIAYSQLIIRCRITFCKEYDQFIKIFHKIWPLLNLQWAKYQHHLQSLPEATLKKILSSRAQVLAIFGALKAKTQEDLGLSGFITSLLDSSDPELVKEGLVVMSQGYCSQMEKQSCGLNVKWILFHFELAEIYQAKYSKDIKLKKEIGKLMFSSIYKNWLKYKDPKFIEAHRTDFFEVSAFFKGYNKEFEFTNLQFFSRFLGSEEAIVIQRLKFLLDAYILGMRENFSPHQFTLKSLLATFRLFEICHQTFEKKLSVLDNIKLAVYLHLAELIEKVEKDKLFDNAKGLKESALELWIRTLLSSMLKNPPPKHPKQILENKILNLLLLDTDLDNANIVALMGDHFCNFHEVCEMHDEHGKKITYIVERR